MDYQEIISQIQVLQAHQDEIFELIVAWTGSPIKRAEYMNLLIDAEQKIRKLEKNLAN